MRPDIGLLGGLAGRPAGRPGWEACCEAWHVGAGAVPRQGVGGGDEAGVGAARVGRVLAVGAG